MSRIRTLLNKDADFVDLGLPSGTLWMRCNLGAKQEYESGLYYYWGGTTGYNVGDSITVHPFKSAISEAIDDSDPWELIDAGCVDRTTIALTDSNDAIWLETDGRFRMPTLDQVAELSRLQKEAVTNYKGSGISGILFHGTNGNTLFIPAVGKGDRSNGTLRTRVGNTFCESFFWSREWYWAFGYDFDYPIWHSFKTSGVHSIARDHDYVYSLFPLRGCSVPEDCLDLVDLGLPSGTLWMRCDVGSPCEYFTGSYFRWGETTKYNTSMGAEYNSDEWGNGVWDWGDWIEGEDGEEGFYDSPGISRDWWNRHKNEYVDSSNCLLNSKDCAYVYTNGLCTLPTDAQIQELISLPYREVYVVDVGSFIEFTGPNGKTLRFRENSGNFTGYNDETCAIPDNCYLNRWGKHTPAWAIGEASTITSYENENYNNYMELTRFYFAATFLCRGVKSSH